MAAEKARRTDDGRAPRRTSEMDDSQVRSRRRSHTGEIPRVDLPPAVVLVSVDDAFARKLVRRLSERASVRQVTDMLDLFGLLETSSGRAVAVIDCTLPSIAPTSVAEMAHLFPHGTSVILWGITPSQRARFVRSYPVAVAWEACTPDAPTDQLIERILEP